MDMQKKIVGNLTMALYFALVATCVIAAFRWVTPYALGSGELSSALQGVCNSIKGCVKAEHRTRFSVQDKSPVLLAVLTLNDARRTEEARKKASVALAEYVKTKSFVFDWAGKAAKVEVMYANK